MLVIKLDLILYISIVFLVRCTCKNALEYVVKHRKLINSTINILSDFNNSTQKRWIEYTYFLSNGGNVKRSNEVQAVGNVTLQVGIVFDAAVNHFDCRYNVNDKNVTEVEGYSIDVINTLGDSLHIRTEYIIMENVENLTKALLHNDIDIAACHPNIGIEKIVQSYPTLNSKFLLVYKPYKLHFTKDIFVLTFAGSLWFVFFISLIVLAVCLRIATLRYSIIYRDHEIWTWVDITLWAIAAACQQGLSNTPRGLTSRWIFLIGYVTSYLLYTGFAAAITSLLVQHNNRHMIDLSTTKTLEYELITLRSTALETTRLHAKFKNTGYVEDMHSFFEYLNIYGNVGVAPEILINLYLAENFDYLEQTNYATVKLDNIKYKRGLCIKSNNEFKKQVNNKLLQLDDKGLLSNILSRHMKNIGILEIESGYSSAGKEHVGSAIFVLLTGIMASLIFILAECAVYFYRKHHKKFRL